MAGDWIKVEHATPDKPEVVKMADMLGIDQDAVIGKLLRLWIWADQQSVDGNALSVTDSFIDRCCFHPGFSSALRKAGWLTGSSGRLNLPNFEKNNGQTAKKRSLTNRRVSKLRQGKEGKSNATNVTEELQKRIPEKRREEKRVLDKSNTYPSAIPQGEEFVSYCVTKLEELNPEWTKGRATKAARLKYETYREAGWKDGNGKAIKNWKTKALNSLKFEKPWSYGTDEQDKPAQERRSAV